MYRFFCKARAIGGSAHRVLRRLRRVRWRLVISDCGRWCHVIVSWSTIPPALWLRILLQFIQETFRWGRLVSLLGALQLELLINEIRPKLGFLRPTGVILQGHFCCTHDSFSETSHWLRALHRLRRRMRSGIRSVFEGRRPKVGG